MATERNKELERHEGGAVVMLVLLSPVAIPVSLVVLLWILGSAAVKIVIFTVAIASGPSISGGRWAIASFFVLAGIVVEVVLLNALFFGKSERARLRRLAAMSAPILAVVLIPAVMFFRVILWLMSFIFPIEWLYLASDGPRTFGQGIGALVALFAGPLVFSAGLAKGVLLAGHPGAELGCGVIREAAAAGLLDVSSFPKLLGQLLTLMSNLELLKAFGFEIVPKFYSLNWWGSSTFASWLEGSGEVIACYASGALHPEPLIRKSNW